MEYKYEGWKGTTKVNDIIKQLNDFSKQGWEVVSHAQNENGMSVIFKKESPK